jgi:hypothetical protein
MRTRRNFAPAVDFMPSRISPSAAGLALVFVPAPGSKGSESVCPSAPAPMDNPTSYPIIAGEPGFPSTINC